MIKELSMFEFDNFAKTHPLKSYHQTSSYATFMCEHGYSYEFIGFYDDNILKVASLILIKKIKSLKYGYAPKGFLIDFYDQDLIKNFTEAIKEYYLKKDLVFIKINPEIAIGEVNNNKDYQTLYNQNVKIIDTLTNNGYKQLKPNYNFESLLPRFNAIVPLKDFDLRKVSKVVRTKLKKADRQGLYLERSNKDNIDLFYKFVKNKLKKDLKYYKDYYNAFEKNSNVELFLVKINYNDLIIKTQQRYEEELSLNNYYNELLINNHKESNINTKMESDKILQLLKNDILKATHAIKIKNEEYIGGALIIKYDNRIHFVRCGFDQRFSNFNPNHFLHYKIMEYYKNDYAFADLNGVTGNLNKESDYRGLNQFKLQFNPKIYEFIGEFDLIIRPSEYEKLEKQNLLFKEFHRDKNA